ncbi:MAG TPA: hypothetical protein VJ044_15425, partial [Candidatus Hodarchaeales archaeon]|nr:hypothetical protein [Candidatus Hodarchaeales archaeon]
LEFMIVPPQQLAPLINEKFEAIVDLQSRVKIKSEEEKVPIDEEMFGFDKKLKRDLESVEITTIEDIYFSSGEMLTTNPAIAETVYKLRRALDIPLSSLEFFSAETVSTLEKRQIATLLHFIMYPNDKLAEILGVSIERVEEGLKWPINLVELSEVVGHPITIIKEFSATQINKLSQMGANLIADIYLLKQQHSPELLKEHDIWRTISSLKISDLAKYAEESEMAMGQILGASFAQKLRDLGIQSLSAVASLSEEKTEIIKKDPALWGQLEKIQGQLKLPVSFVVPKRFRAIVDKAAKANLISVLDFIAASTQTPSTLPISSEELESLKKYLKPDVLVPAFSIPLTTFPVLSAHLSALAEKGIETLGALVTSSPNELEILTGDSTFSPESFSNNFSLWDMIEPLNVPITFALDLDEGQLASMSRKKVLTLLDWWKTPQETMASIFSVDPAATEKIWNGISWNDVWEALEAPIGVDDNLPLSWKLALGERLDAPLHELLAREPIETVEQLQANERTVKAWRNSARYKGILEAAGSNRRKQVMVSYAKYASGRMKKAGSEVKIAGERIDLADLKNKWGLPIQSLQDLPNTIQGKLIRKNIRTIRELYACSNENLTTEVDISAEELAELEQKTWIPNLTVSAKSTTPLESFTFLGKEILKQMESSGYRRLTDLLRIPVDDSKPSILARRVLRALRSPIVFVPGITLSEINELSVMDILTLEALFSASEPEKGSIEDVRGKITAITGVESERKRKGIFLEEISIINESLKHSLAQQFNCQDLTVQEVAFLNARPNPEMVLNKSDALALQKVLGAYFGPLPYYSDLFELAPGAWEPISEKGVKYVYQFLDFLKDPDTLARLTGILPEQAKELTAKFDFEKVISAQKRESIKLSSQNSLYKLKEEDLTKLETLNISSVQDLYYSSEIRLDSGQKAMLASLKKKAGLVNIQGTPLSRIQGISISDIPKLKQVGIKTLEDFLFAPITLLKANSKLKATEIVRIREQPVFLDKAEIQSKIDRFFEPKQVGPTPEMQQEQVEKTGLQRKEGTKKIPLSAWVEGSSEPSAKGNSIINKKKTISDSTIPGSAKTTPVDKKIRQKPLPEQQNKSIATKKAAGTATIIKKKKA